MGSHLSSNWLCIVAMEYDPTETPLGIQTHPSLNKYWIASLPDILKIVKGLALYFFIFTCDGSLPPFIFLLYGMDIVQNLCHMHFLGAILISLLSPSPPSTSHASRLTFITSFFSSYISISKNFITPLQFN